MQLKTAQLQLVTREYTDIVTKLANIARVKMDVFGWYNSVKSSVEVCAPQPDPSGELFEHINKLTEARSYLDSAVNIFASVWHSLDAKEKAEEQKKIHLEAQSRGMRQDIEAIQVGSGQIMRRSQEVRSKIAQLATLSELHNTKTLTLAKIIEKRNSLLDSIDSIRHDRFKQRSGVINQLNSSLAPSIKLSISRNGQPTAFSAVLSELLRGSGVKYGEISPLIANTISPRTLLEAVDSFDLDLIVNSTGITTERASKILAHLRTMDLASLIAVEVEDEVSMYLLDGADYKNISELSTGQRCTVILPIVLAHPERVVVVDQPEDHIDNAFIAGTLIKAIINRDAQSQMIFSTHNPNIPVLGNAENVVQLSSDGRRGYVDASGNLFSAPVVSAISTVMEGGSAAFAKRANFYSQNINA